MEQHTRTRRYLLLFVDMGTSRMSIAATCIICHGHPIGMFVSGDLTSIGSLDFWHVTHSLQCVSTSWTMFTSMPPVVSFPVSSVIPGDQLPWHMLKAC